MYDHRPPGERGALPWEASGGKEVVLDALTLGIARKHREHRIRAHYASLDKTRLSPGHGVMSEVSPHLLPHLKPGAEKLAQLALQVVSNAQAIRIETHPGYEATLICDADDKRQASSTFASDPHEPTLLRVREATGRDYTRDLRATKTLTVLHTFDRNVDMVDIEGLGLLANEYFSRNSMTGRLTDMAFLIRGLPSTIAGDFVDTLQAQPERMLDGIAYTAFADVEPPGRSMLQIPLANQPPASLIRPETCNRVITAAMPRL